MANELTVDDIKSKILKKANLIKWGGGVLVAILVAPIIWALAWSMLGVAALSAATFIAAAVALLIVNFWPVLVMKVANAKINAIVTEATKNPIPTLWGVYQENEAELNAFEQSIEDYETEILNTESNLDKLRPKMSAKDIQGFEKDIATLRIDLGLQQEDLRQAHADLAKFETEIERADAIWKMNMAVNKANAANRNLAQDTIQKIKRDTSLEAVTGSMNRSKAQLAARIRNRASASTVGTDQPTMLTHSPSDVLDVTPVSETLKVLQQ